MRSDFSYSDVANMVWRRNLASKCLNNYAGILSMHGFARLAKIRSSNEFQKEINECLRPFLRGEVKEAYGMYGENVYRFGGNALAYQVFNGKLPEGIPVLERQAEQLIKTQSRDERGIFDMPRKHGFVWIDTVFGVCPFLLWAGLCCDRVDFIDEAVFQMLQHTELLWDEERMLFHQAIGFCEPDRTDEAHWGRGNGWAALALAELAADLPAEHPGKNDIVAIYRRLMTSCREYQTPSGMLRQSIDDPESYEESTGTGLILYAMGRGIENGILDRGDFCRAFKNGIKGLNRFVSMDGSVFNGCIGCCAPGTGTLTDYRVHPWEMNESHAFGPVILAFGVAEELCEREMLPDYQELIFETFTCEEKSSKPEHEPKRDFNYVFTVEKYEPLKHIIETRLMGYIHSHPIVMQNPAINPLS